MKKKHKDTPVEDLKNLGVACKRMLNHVGVYTREDLEKRGVNRAYEDVRLCFPNVSRVMFYALHGALADVHWVEVAHHIKG
jgi:DNA transformation protein